jgi:hypothetical protein
VPAYIVLAVEVVAAFLGGSYWLHYLLGLIPGVVLLAAAFAQRPAPVTRSIGGSFVVAGLSGAIAIGSLAIHPTQRPEDAAVRYLDEHGSKGDTGVVVLGAANIVRDAGLRAPYPYLWSLPARVRDRDLGTLDGLLRSQDRPTWVVVADGAVVEWGLDFTKAQAELDADYERVTTAGKFTIYRRNDS